MVARPQSSAAGAIALLEEPEPILKEHALKVLISLVPQFWAEISEYIALMYAHHMSFAWSVTYPDIRRESLYESKELSQDTRSSAALLASKVYYYLEEYDEALSFALGAGNAFETDSRTPGSEEYVETIICQCTLMKQPTSLLDV